MTTKIKSYADDFTIRLGPIQTTGRLMPLHNSSVKKVTKFFSVTPDGKKVTQRYIDDDGNLFLPKELKKGMINPEDGNVVIVDPETVKEATASVLPKNVLELTAHDTSDVDEKIVPAKSQVVYVFEPDTNDPLNVKWHDLLLTALERGDKTLVGICNLQNNEGLFRVSTWHGNILVSKQASPNELYEYDTPEPVVDNAEVESVLNLLEKLSSPFNPRVYKDSQIEKVKTLKQAVLDGTELKPVVSPVASKVDILAILDDFEV